MLCHAVHFVERCSLLWVIIMAPTCTKLSIETFAVQHNPYPLSKFKLGRPSQHREMAESIIILMMNKNNNKNMNIKKDKNPRLLNLVYVSHALHTCMTDQYVAQLSFSRAVAFFLLLVAAFSCGAMSYVLKLT